ncbi:methyltransferase dimerization domain-containing protein [Halodesulfovibrio sp.]|jgi:predicted O-methyltransferase YrrM|uniref:methyltransferase family protein n=1 Tax=Halodesulfovibrio sp. TaxID=1912772 RepID=UPI0025FB3357|nr:methyltransferase dimerization domain-containing protein [Halodesulfovibrio sp.]MCT4535212.1 methyltransferase [Halodesulfovibrio sp.]
MSTAKPNLDFAPIRTMLVESISSKVLMSAVDLAVFDHLEKPSTATALAEKLGAVPELLESILDLLVAISLLNKVDGTYQNSPMASEFLVSTAPFYQGDHMRLTMSFNDIIENSITNLVTGKKAAHTDAAKKWSVAKAMEGCAQNAKGCGLASTIEFITSLPDFKNFKTMCDIGGNHGLYSMAVLDQNKNMNAMLFDLPPVAAQAQKRCDEAGYADRLTTYGIDFKKDRLPAEQFDLVFTSHVLYAFKNMLPETLGKISDGLHSGGWFVSHHYTGREEQGQEKMKASLEVLTRLSGHPSHFIEKDELVGLLESLNFTDIRCQPVANDGTGLMVAARKQ